MDEVLRILFVIAVIVALVTGWWRMNSYCSSLEEKPPKSGRQYKCEHGRCCEGRDGGGARTRQHERRYNKPKLCPESRMPRSPVEIINKAKYEKNRRRKLSSPGSDVEILTRNELVDVKRQLKSVCSKIDQILK